MKIHAAALFSSEQHTGSRRRKLRKEGEREAEMTIDVFSQPPQKAREIPAWSAPAWRSVPCPFMEKSSAGSWHFV